MSTTVSVGNITIDAILDLKPPAVETLQFFPDVAPEAWHPYRQYLDKAGRFQHNFSAWLLRSDTQVMLVDTGLGPGPHNGLGRARGQLTNRLMEKGVALEDISTVIITHLHGDHIGWNITHEDGMDKPTFPNATYLLPNGDWQYFTQPEILDHQLSVQINALPLKELGITQLIDGGYQITPEISTISTPGHTPGHLSVLIDSCGQKAIIVGDLFISPAQISEPDWCSRGDMDKDMARRTRRAMLHFFQNEDYVVASGHIPIGENIGRVVFSEGYRCWQVL